jgi:hypothetical protein
MSLVFVARASYDTEMSAKKCVTPAMAGAAAAARDVLRRKISKIAGMADFILRPIGTPRGVT